MIPIMDCSDQPTNRSSSLTFHQKPLSVLLNSLRSTFIMLETINKFIDLTEHTKLSTQKHLVGDFPPKRKDRNFTYKEC
jgi:hypothetical protein